MSETIHTPGPWEAKEGDVIADGDVIAIAYGRSAATPTEEIFANAKLFAAAPDLLASVAELLADMPYECDCDCCECDPFIEDGDCCHMRAHVALAKAKGGK